MQVYQVLAGKSIDAIWSITRDTTVFQALEVMALKNIGAVLVIENNELMGIFSGKGLRSESDFDGQGVPRNTYRRCNDFQSNHC